MTPNEILNALFTALKPKSTTPVPELRPQDIVVPSSPFDDLSDEEILYYATPYFDELQARKEAQKQKLNEGELYGQD